MRRVLISLLVVCGAAAYVLTQAGAGEEAGNRFKVELDNAFGLVVGADLKVAGVRAGQITDMDVDRESKRAIIEFEVTKTGFGSLRTDVFCESRPQSLIGEYYIDCQPGTDSEELKAGSTIPVEQTGSTVPADLVNNIMRRPYRERLRIILNELGYGVGARAEDLNEAIRRASPALRETNRVLRILARQNQLLGDLVEDGDTVITDLAENKRDVARWVKETGETAEASAARREAIAASLERLPEFLRELRPTMAELGRAADAQRPALVDLQASAGQLEELFTDLEPFAEASQVNLRSLAQASRPGRRAMEAAQPSVEELGRFSETAPEVSKNLGIILSHLDDREASAIEPDPRSPGGQGYTGLEAILQYVFDQTMAINIFDRNGYILKVNVHEGECAEYQNLDSLKEHLAEDPEFLDRCLGRLGPNYPGLNQEDPSAGFGAEQPAQRRARDDDRTRSGERTPAGDERPDAGGTGEAKPPVDLKETIEDLLGPVPLPDLLKPDLEKLPKDLQKLPKELQEQLGAGTGTGTTSDDEGAADALVDFLFGS